MTQEQQAKIDELYTQLGKLAGEFQAIVSPTEEEIDTAVEMLTDDPYNNIQSIVDPSDSCGLIMICQQVLDDRVYEEEEREEG